MAEPPSVVGTAQVNVAAVLPGVTINDNGADGAPAGTIAPLDAELPVPAWFTAAMRNVYDVPFAKPVTV